MSTNYEARDLPREQLHKAMLVSVYFVLAFVVGVVLFSSEVPDLQHVGAGILLGTVGLISAPGYFALPLVLGIWKEFEDIGGTGFDCGDIALTLLGAILLWRLTRHVHKVRWLTNHG